MSVVGDIIDSTNYTTQEQAKQPKVTGAASANLSVSEFLNLMLKQLQFQDPMEPQGNAEFVSQQCQFAQLQATQEMNENITMNNSISQTLSLVGKEVDLIDPNNPENTITGVIKEAKFTSKGATIVVNDKEYPISLIKTVREASTTPKETTTS